ncbi:MBL fold metallo-hydrolase [Chloroflexota bacterium]
MNIKTLGAHNCESRNTKLTTLLIDDIIAIDAGALTSSLTFPAQRKLRAVLLTHQHYDHIKDIPTIAFNSAMAGTTINIYSTLPVYEALNLILGNKLYPNFLEFPQENPSLKFTLIEPYQTEQIEGYDILPLPVNHSALTIGYQITSADGKTVFYTGDTGPGLEDCWQHISPQLLITEVSAPNRFETLYKRRGHFTPDLLKEELTSFRKLKGYRPRVVIIHMNPGLEAEIKAELATVAQDLNHSITLAHEGMKLRL